MTRIVRLDRRQERGQVTLLVALVLLVAITIVVLFTARSAIVEQRVSANETRAKQAMAAAEAGLDRAHVYMREDGLDQDDDGTLDVLATQTLGNGATNRVLFCDGSDPEFNPASGGHCARNATGTMTCNAASPRARHATIVACGWSDDSAARHQVTQVVRSSPSMANPPSNPLTARGTVNVAGNMTVVNYYNNLTIWTGQTLDYNNATAKTFIRDPNLPAPETPDLDDPDALAGYPAVPEDINFANCSNTGDYYICGTHKDARGPDVIESDTTLRNLSNEQLFESYFGLPPDDYRDQVVTSEVTHQELTDGDSRDGEIIWLDEGGSINRELGTRLDPVILIVDGDVEFGGNAVIHGIVYVRGDLGGSGTPRIYGSIIVEGEADGTGNVTVLYDPVAAGGAASIGELSGVPGSWRDWAQP
ncbi:MAG: PilX N-terminal domain-containing pilus assembly protein [Halothiobacillaceae bacterium]